MKKKSIFLIITTLFFMNTVTTTENCITGFACKINQIDGEKEQHKSVIQKEIQNSIEKDKHNQNMTEENKIMKIDKNSKNNDINKKQK